MILSQVPVGGQCRPEHCRQETATVLAQGSTGTLVAVVRHKEVPFEGRLIRSRERRLETWSQATVVEQIGQLSLDLA